MRTTRHSTWLALGLLASAAAVRLTGTAADAATAATPAGATPPATPIVAAKADQVLRDMSDYLRAAPQLSFHADITFDDFLPTGQQIQLAADYDAALRRPDRFYTEYAGDAGRRRLWYDGTRITLYDPDLGAYATDPAPNTIDKTLQHLITDLGFTPPLSDLLSDDPYAVLRRNVLVGLYLGETQVAGVRCHHLAFVERDIDWQVWIEGGIRWVPRKVLITYKTMPGAPRFAALFSGWDLATRPPDALFTAVLPSGAAQIPFLTAAAQAAGKPKGGPKP